MNQQQQRILMRSSLAMGITVALGMLAFGQVTGTPSPVANPDAVAVETAASTPVGIATPERVLSGTELAATSMAAEGRTLQAQEVSRVAQAREDDDEHERAERHESPNRSTRRER